MMLQHDAQLRITHQSLFQLIFLEMLKNLPNLCLNFLILATYSDRLPVTIQNRFHLIRYKSLLL